MSRLNDTGGKQMSGVTGAASLPADEVILERLQKRDPDAFRLLFEKYYNSVLGYSISFLGNPSTAEDVAQEVFVKVHEHAGSIRNTTKFKSWILSLTRNLSIDFIRKSKNRKELSISQPDFLDNLSQTRPELSVEQDFHCNVSPRELPLLSSLNLMQREIVVLRIVEGMSYQEIAEITGCSPENTRKIMSRTIEKLTQKEGV